MERAELGTVLASKRMTRGSQKVFCLAVTEKVGSEKERQRIAGPLQGLRKIEM